MLVGVMTDSHGRVKPVQAALRLFDEMEVGKILHCGDVGSVELFDEFVGRDFEFVWGNTDSPDYPLRSYITAVGLPLPPHPPLRVEIDGKSIEVYHGHEAEFRRSLRNPTTDYILHGHTHICRDERVGRARVINSGALHRASVLTVAILDTQSDTVCFHPIETG